MEERVPKLLLFSGIFSRREDRVEDIFGVGICEILRVYFSVLAHKTTTFTCFLPELETRTGFEYFTRLCGWLKLVGPWVDDICNFLI